MYGSLKHILIVSTHPPQHLFLASLVSSTFHLSNMSTRISPIVSPDNNAQRGRNNALTPLQELNNKEQFLSISRNTSLQQIPSIQVELEESEECCICLDTHPPSGIVRCFARHGVCIGCINQLGKHSIDKIQDDLTKL